MQPVDQPAEALLNAPGHAEAVPGHRLVLLVAGLGGAHGRFLAAAVNPGRLHAIGKA